MPRLAILNMLIGFSLIFLAASAGAFIAVDATQRYLVAVTAPTWRELVQTSSHGHTSLFGLIHIAFGLTLPYSALGSGAKRLQTIGLACGAAAMGPGMLLRASFGPTPAFEWNGLVLGGLLALALAALGLHVYGLSLKLVRRL